MLTLGEIYFPRIIFLLFLKAWVINRNEYAKWMCEYAFILREYSFLEIVFEFNLYRPNESKWLYLSKIVFFIFGFTFPPLISSFWVTSYRDTRPSV